MNPPTAVGTRVAEKHEEYLSKVIDILNERFGTSFTQADELFFEQVREQAKQDAEVVQRAVASTARTQAYAMQRYDERRVQEIANRSASGGRKGPRSAELETKNPKKTAVGRGAPSIQ